MAPHQGTLRTHDTLATVFRRWVAGTRVDAVEGLGHIPASGPVLVVANHPSFFDHYLLETVLYAARGAPVHYPAKAANFRRPLQRTVRRRVGCIPLDSDRPDRHALRAMVAVLGAGEVLCMYPEGTRWTGAGLLPFHDGAFYLAVRTGLPVVPVMTYGSDRILPKGALRPRRGTARLVFGPPLAPLPPGPASGPARGPRIAELRGRARARMAELGERARTAHGRPDPRAARHILDRAAGIAAASARAEPGAAHRTAGRRIAVLRTLARATAGSAV